MATSWQQALVLEVDRDGRFSGDQGAPVPLREPGELQPDDILLGNHGGRTWFARPTTELTAGDPTPWRETRPGYWDLTAAAVALVRWHGTRPRCDRCGEPTIPDSGGARRRCPECGALAFARQDPAVIVAILDPSDRLLLARQSIWPESRVSVIAGFVEAGESLEQAVWREVAEEVGVALSAVRYVSSQPWPMPRSLMLGFVAAASDARLQPDGDEIVEARYWERDELTRAVAAGELTLPGGASIARQLVDAWLSGELQRPEAG
ncbi:NAD(+) diphosphatase [Tessaracoccus sp. OS52]|uniref:NAD(+) diphosphatase n=1 Tax=Tessaracoccus sp. OS52 TaxID=2886691 RepID=UPI001D10F474|nr:NAD(+) diphosphatase [Tessaracoccus sp. OS52]